MQNCHPCPETSHFDDRAVRELYRTHVRLCHSLCLVRKRWSTRYIRPATFASPAGHRSVTARGCCPRLQNETLNPVAEAPVTRCGARREFAGRSFGQVIPVFDGCVRRACPRVDREEMIKMTALGLLLMLVVVATIVYIAGLAWLARHDVRQAESPPTETIRPDLTGQRS
jgi:hypothetical protein